jgi:hypothetical protein
MSCNNTYLLFIWDLSLLRCRHSAHLFSCRDYIILHEQTTVTYLSSYPAGIISYCMNRPPLLTYLPINGFYVASMTSVRSSWLACIFLPSLHSELHLLDHGVCALQSASSNCCIHLHSHWWLMHVFIFPQLQLLQFKNVTKSDNVLWCKLHLVLICIFLTISEIKSHLIGLWSIGISTLENVTIKLFVSNCLVGVLHEGLILVRCWLYELGCVFLLSALF